jgi:hypothetical protein
MIIRNCTGCGQDFTTNDLRKTRCKKNCGRTSADSHTARTRRRDDHILEFIGVDGEGVTRPSGEHIYDMLSVGDNTLTNPDGSQLHWKQIFAFLYENFQENPHAVYAGFFLGYDFTQWFRTLPEDRARMLLSTAGRVARRRTAPGTEHLGPFPVRAESWEFDILGTKRFKLRPGQPHGVKNNAPWMYINDTGPFFQASFLTVIDPASWDRPVCTQEEYDLVAQGKADRGTVMDLDGQLATRDQTGRYNTLENDILGRVLHRLNEGFTDAGVRLGRRQWYGPGQAAQAWMNRIEAPTASDVQETVPRWTLDAARDTYYGGWFEIFAHGHIPGTSYEYDINSAYPAIIAQLPCLLHGHWTRHGAGHTPGTKETLILVRATVEGTDPHAGAMPHREKDGRVLRPSRTSGWHWRNEILAAQRAGLVDTIDIHEAIHYEPCDCPPPFEAEMVHLYKKRLEVGKNTPSGKAYKLVYNSAYGKLAQSIGMPKYANPVYASLITAGTRTMILDAIATHPAGTDDLLMVATDGVYFRTPHPHLELSDSELGKWDVTEKHNLTLFMPGVYWDEHSREQLREGKAPKLRSRGISARDLANCISSLDIQFAEFTPGDPWPGISIPVAFNMTTATQALARGKWHTAGHVHTDGLKTISSDPVTKRPPGMLEMDRGILRSYCYTAGQQLETTPYSEAFGLPAPDEGLSQDGHTPQEDLRNLIIR